MSPLETRLASEWDLDRWADRLKLAFLFFGASLIVIGIGSALQGSVG